MGRELEMKYKAGGPREEDTVKPAKKLEKQHLEPQCPHSTANTRCCLGPGKRGPGVRKTLGQSYLMQGLGEDDDKDQFILPATVECRHSSLPHFAMGALRHRVQDLRWSFPVLNLTF
jgi:hypothetical protein